MFSCFILHMWESLLRIRGSARFYTGSRSMIYFYTSWYRAKLAPTPLTSKISKTSKRRPEDPNTVTHFRKAGSMPIQSLALTRFIIVYYTLIIKNPVTALKCTLHDLRLSFIAKCTCLGHPCLCLVFLLYVLYVLYVL
jgi:hypothetical protein